MENNIEKNTFFVYRGATKCIDSAFRFVMTNFKSLVMITWPVALVYCLVYAIMMRSQFDMAFMSIATDELNLANQKTDYLLLGLQLVYILSAFVMEGYKFASINVHRDGLSLAGHNYRTLSASAKKYTLRYTSAISVFLLTAVVPLLVISVLSGTVMSFLPFGTELSAALALGFIFILLFVFAGPLSFALVNVMMEHAATPWASYKQGVKRGFRVWGKMFCMLFLLALVFFAVAMLLLSPSFVLSSMHYAATSSTYAGDSVSIPGIVDVLYPLSLLLASVVFVVFGWISTMSITYLYASVVFDEKQEEGLKLN